MKKSLLFTVLSVTLLASILSFSTNMNTSVYAEENEAEIEADIEQENKCKKDTECENENELNNQLTITNITQAQTQEESQTTLNVTKTVTCVVQEETVGVSQAIYICDEVGPEDFEITVTGNNPNPSQFPGSETGTVVTLGAGSYTVSESLVGATEATFSGDCTQTGPLEAEGTISDGETQTCTIDNEVTIRAD